MRTAITIGIKKDGTADVISHPKVSMHEQRVAFRALTRGKNDKYVEVQYWPSKGRMMRRRFKNDEKGGVNYNAAHPVHAQQSARKNGGKKLDDLTPKQGDHGGVNMEAALPIAQQGQKSKAKKAAPKKLGAHTAGAKVVGAPSSSAGGSSEEKSAPDGSDGPTL